jgi:hypothetical protein
MPVHLRFRSVSVRFSPARYLRFRSRVLTASREVTYRRATLPVGQNDETFSMLTNMPWRVRSLVKRVPVSSGLIVQFPWW